MSRFVTTVLVDHSTLFREGISRILSETKYRIVASIESLGLMTPPKAKSPSPALFVVGMDATMEGVQDSLREIKRRHTQARLVVLADVFSSARLSAALRGGADGYLLKSTTSDALIKSLDVIMLGKSVLSPGIQQLIEANIHLQEPARRIEPPLSQALSERELQILRCLVYGDSNKVIARRFQIAEATVKVHMKAILRKVHATNRTQAAIWAMDNSLVIGLNEPNRTIDLR